MESFSQSLRALAEAAAKSCGAQFSLLDLLRRAEGDLLESLWIGRRECAFRIVSSTHFWRLREYVQSEPAPSEAGPSLLIVPAPIKRAYIWDLVPAVSPVRNCLEQGLRVFLLEWMPPSEEAARTLGLKEYVGAISACLERIAAEADGMKSFVIAHSLGGTLAALHCALVEDRLEGLVLLGSPICFEAASSHFRDALVSIIPAGIGDMPIVPGSLLAQASALAAPGPFIWARLRDMALSATDRDAWSIMLRVERWALDELPLSGRLVGEIMNLLYRENRFCRGTLQIEERLIGPTRVRVPVLAVVNTADEVAPLNSVAPFLSAMPVKATRIIEYPGEAGVGLQHLAMLIGRVAHRQIWPQIFSWISGIDQASARS